MSNLFKPPQPNNEPPPDVSFQKPAMGQSAIPDLLRVGSIPSNQEAMIDTDILEPVIFTDSFIRFQLVNKGFLNPYSRVCLQLDNVSSKSASNVRSFPSLGVGIGACVQNATLKIGTKTICETNDWAWYESYKSMFIANETNKEREQYLSGRAISHDQHYTTGTNQCSFIGLDNGREYVQNASGVKQGLSAHPFQLVDNKGVFSITLEELFPIFKNTSFPLYMLNSDMPVQIELTLNPSTDGSRCSTNACATTNALVDITINRQECRLIADYSTYSGDLMSAYANANREMTWNYMDYQLTKTTLADSTAGENQIRNVGGAGRLVPRMFVGISQNNASANSTLLNLYSSEANVEAGGDYGRLTSNVKKNDRFVFPIDRSNTALHFHGVADTEGMMPFVSRDEYGRQGGRMTEAVYEEHAQNTNLSGKFFWTAYKMPDGERVNSRGLELHSKMLSLPAGSYTARTWIECMKVATLIDGEFSCYFA
tara:strand:- start:5782 stop:7230 length:1449 start_codon:yes stop_codon:yes gene_type:complete